MLLIGGMVEGLLHDCLAGAASHIMFSEFFTDVQLQGGENSSAGQSTASKQNHSGLWERKWRTEEYLL